MSSFHEVAAFKALQSRWATSLGTPRPKGHSTTFRCRRLVRDIVRHPTGMGFILPTRPDQNITRPTGHGRSVRSGTYIKTPPAPSLQSMQTPNAALNRPTNVKSPLFMEDLHDDRMTMNANIHRVRRGGGGGSSLCRRRHRALSIGQPERAARVNRSSSQTHSLSVSVSLISHRSLEVHRGSSGVQERLSASRQHAAGVLTDGRQPSTSTRTSPSVVPASRHSKNMRGLYRSRALNRRRLRRPPLSHAHAHPRTQTHTRTDTAPRGPMETEVQRQPRLPVA